MAALVSAASFDFFLTRPYESFLISRQADLTTEVLFVVVGLLVGELAARGRRHRRDAAEGRHELTRIHDMAERIAGGEEPDFVLMAVAAELRDLLSLQDCRFVWDPPSGKGAWIEADGTVRLNPLRWPTAVGRPADQAGRAAGAGRGADPRDLHPHADPGAAHLPGAVRGGGGAGRPARLGAVGSFGPALTQRITNCLGLVRIPVGVVSTMGPVLAPTGTTAMILPGATLRMTAGTPPKVTWVTPDSLLPQICTSAPVAPPLGLTRPIVGAFADTRRWPR